MFEDSLYLSFEFARRKRFWSDFGKGHEMICKCVKEFKSLIKV